MFLQPIKAVEKRSYAFMFGNAQGEVHYGEHKHLHSATASHDIPIPHSALPLMHYL